MQVISVDDQIRNGHIGFGEGIPGVKDITPKLSSFEHLRITDHNPIAEPEARIWIGDAIIATCGDMTGISGGPKLGKSALSNACIAGGINQTGFIDGFPNVYVKPNNVNKAVIHIDTEQSKAAQYKNMLNTIRRSGLSSMPPHYLSYNIRELDLNEYEAVTDGIFTAAFDTFGGIHFAVIDGIADYIESPNDEAQSKAIVKYFMSLSSRFDCPIITVIHTNPNSTKERGHIGSEMQRKVGSLIGVEQMDGTSYLVPRFLRYAGRVDMPQLCIGYDSERGYHIEMGEMEKPITESSEVKRMNKCVDLTKRVWTEEGVGFKYGETINKLMVASTKSERTVKDLLKEMKAHGFIAQNEDQKYYRLLPFD